MLTRSKIINDGYYCWETDYAIPDNNFTMGDFLRNEIPDDVDIISRDGNQCVLYIFGIKCEIMVHGNGDFTHHVAEIKILDK